MKQKNFEWLKSRGYVIIRCIDNEERYRLMRGDEIVLDDSACEDYYGDKETVTEVFAEYVREYVLPEEQQVEAALSAYDDGMGYTIIQSVNLTDDAKLMTFVSDNGIAKSSAVVYGDGTIFVTDDWQGSFAETHDEIEDYTWYTLDGRKAVILDSLPHVI